MYDFWQDNYEWLLSGIIPTLITAIFGIIKYRKNKRNKDVSQEKNIQTNTIYANNNSGHIINNNHQNINIGDTKNTAERRYKNAIEIVKNELLDNYRDLCVLINGIEERVPQKFWDVRKPNDRKIHFRNGQKTFLRNIKQEFFN